VLRRVEQLPVVLHHSKATSKPFEDAANLASIQRGFSILIKGPGERPVTVAMPVGEAKPSVSFKGRVAVGANELVVSGDGLDKLKAVKFKNSGR
jgi:hypothetical protein